MTPAKIKTYMQDGHVKQAERWRCDVYPFRSDDHHHGVGATEAEALLNAALAYRHQTDREAVDAI